MSEDWGICTKNEPHSASHAVRPAVFNAADARHSPCLPAGAVLVLNPMMRELCFT